MPAPEESEAESDVQPVLAVGGRSAAGEEPEQSPCIAGVLI